MTARFHNPVDTRFGWGSLQELVSITENQTVALVTFPEARALGLVDRLQALLGDRLVYVIEDVQPNPDVAQLRGTYERFWQEAGDCHTVLAVGGGSAIDTAKALIVASNASSSSKRPDSVPTINALAVSMALPPPTAITVWQSPASCQKRS